MASESGDLKLLGNFRRLIDLLAAEPGYAPPNPKLTVAAMNTQHTASLAAATGVPNKMAPNKIAISERQAAFDQLPVILPRTRNVLKASGAAKEVIADVDTSYKKTLGRRVKATVKDDPSTPANEATSQHSALQTSYDNQRANAGAYVALLGQIPQYQPNDNSLKLPALNALLNDLQAKSDTVSQTFVPLNQARGLRDRLLYLDDDCVVNIALLAKSYVAGEFGTTSALYRAIKALKFDRQRK